MHSPVYLTDQALYAALESDSDWDYYTDEYYDDDPSLANEQDESVADQSARKKRKRSSVEPKDHSTKQGRRRTNGRLQPDIDSFRGVVWRSPYHALHKDELYEEGKGEAVALLKNWREIFKHHDSMSAPMIYGSQTANRQLGRPKRKSHPRGARKTGYSRPELYESASSPGEEEDLEDDNVAQKYPHTTENSNHLTPPPCHLNEREQGTIPPASKVNPSSDTHERITRSKKTTPTAPSRLKQVTTAEELTPPSSTESEASPTLPPDTAAQRTKSSAATGTAEDSSRPHLNSRTQVVVGAPRSSNMSHSPPPSSSSSSPSSTLANRSASLSSGKHHGRKRKTNPSLLNVDSEDRQEELEEIGEGRPSKTRRVVSREVTEVEMSVQATASRRPLRMGRK